jgi:hypothetical protein
MDPSSQVKSGQHYSEAVYYRCFGSQWICSFNKEEVLFPSFNTRQVFQPLVFLRQVLRKRMGSLPLRKR